MCADNLPDYRCNHGTNYSLETPTKVQWDSLEISAFCISVSILLAAALVNKVHTSGDNKILKSKVEKGLLTTIRTTHPPTPPLLFLSEETFSKWEVYCI